MTTKEVAKKTSWQDEARAEAWVQDASPMNELPVLKVYNKPMGNSAVEDPVKAGKIIMKRGGSDWEVFWEEVKLNILCVRKFHTGFVPRINEFWDIVKDENHKPIKDFYYTPEVDVFNKDNIPLGVIRKWEKAMVIGKATKQDFDEYCKSPKIGNEINPLFKEVKTNENTGERYTTSYMKLGYVIYAQDLETKQIYKIIPGWSYGRFNDIKEWTFEDLKHKAKDKYYEETGTQVLDSFINTKVSVVHKDWFYYLDWRLDSFVEEDNRQVVNETKELIHEFNLGRFKGVDFEKPLEALPYNINKAIEAPKDLPKNVEHDQNWEISVSDIPF